jgi:Type IV secretory system Conjugative DNA transfer
MKWLFDLFRSDPPSQLGSILFHWPDGTPYRLEDALRHVSIFGMTGSGKSSGSGLFFGLALLCIPNSGGLILASKPEDREFWEGLFKATGREDSLIVFGEEEKERFNFLDFLKKDPREITKCILVISETLKKGGKLGVQQFWEQEKERALYNAISVLLIAYGHAKAPQIQQFIQEAALATEQFKDADWRKSFHNVTMRLAHDSEKRLCRRWS